MSEKFISFEEGSKDILMCAAFIAERLKSADGRADAMRQIVPQILADGNVDLAAALADSVEDPVTRDRLITAVAEKCAEMDDDEYAFQLADAVEDISLRAQALEAIAVQKALKGESQKALAAAADLDHPDPVIITVAGKLYAESEREEAVGLVERLGMPVSRATVWQHFAAVAFKEEDKPRAAELLERAAKAASEIDFDEERLRTRLDIGNNFVDVERNDLAIAAFDAARADAEAIASVQRDSFLAAVAVGFFRAGSVDLADRVLDMVSDKSAMISALSGFAAIHRKKGETAEAVEAVEEALEIIHSQKEKETRDHSVKFSQWMGLSLEYAFCGEDDKAMAAAAEIPDEDVRSKAFARLAAVFADQSREKAVTDAVSSITGPLERGLARIAEADVRSANGDPSGTRAALASAVSLVSEVETPMARANLLSEAVRRYLKIGEEAAGRELGIDCCRAVEAIMDESVKASSLAQLSAAYRENGIAPSSQESEVLGAIISKL